MATTLSIIQNHPAARPYDPRAKIIDLNKSIFEGHPLLEAPVYQLALMSWCPDATIDLADAPTDATVPKWYLFLAIREDRSKWLQIIHRPVNPTTNNSLCIDYAFWDANPFKEHDKKPKGITVLDVAKDLLVKDIHKFLDDYYMHGFHFSKKGRGNRFWLLIVIAGLFNNTFIARTTEELPCDIAQHDLGFFIEETRQLHTAMKKMIPDTEAYLRSVLAVVKKSVESNELYFNFNGTWDDGHSQHNAAIWSHTLDEVLWMGGNKLTLGTKGWATRFLVGSGDRNYNMDTDYDAKESIKGELTEASHFSDNYTY